MDGILPGSLLYLSSQTASHQLTSATQVDQNDQIIKEEKELSSTVSDVPDVLLDKIQVFCVPEKNLIIWIHSAIAENIIHGLHFLIHRMSDASDCRPFSVHAARSKRQWSEGSEVWQTSHNAPRCITVIYFLPYRYVWYIFLEGKSQKESRASSVSVCCLSAVGARLATQWPRKHNTRPTAGADVSVTPKKYSWLNGGCNATMTTTPTKLLKTIKLKRRLNLWNHFLAVTCWCKDFFGGVVFQSDRQRWAFNKSDKSIELQTCRTFTDGQHLHHCWSSFTQHIHRPVCLWKLSVSQVLFGSWRQTTKKHKNDPYSASA